MSAAIALAAAPVVLLVCLVAVVEFVKEVIR